jgi:ABC-type spermidine/putrescine transport system permease subunit I
MGVALPLGWLLRLSLYSRGAAAGERQFDVLFYQPGTWTLENYARVFTDWFYVRTLLFTVGLGLAVTAVTVTVGYVLAYAVYRSGPRGKAALLALIVLPKFANVIVFVYGLKILFGASGLVPVGAGEVWMLVPYAALTIAAALASVPPQLVEAARGLGASAASAFWSVTFRLSLPGTAAATILTLLWSMGAFLSPYLLGTPDQYTVSVLVDRETNSDLNWAMAAALNVVLMAIVAALGLAATRVRRWFA